MSVHASSNESVVRFIYTYLPVSDLKRSRDWYVEHFGFEVFGETELRVAPTVLLTLVETDDRTAFRILQNGKPRPIIGFCVVEVNSLHAILEDRGVTMTGIVRYNWGSVFEFFDPDGNQLEVWSGYSDVGWE